MDKSKKQMDDVISIYFLHEWRAVTVPLRESMQPDSRTVRTPLLRDKTQRSQKTKHSASAAMRQLNVPSGTLSVCCVLSSAGTDQTWHGELNRRNLGLSLHTPPRLAGNGLANPDVFSWEALKGSETPSPPDSKG